MTLYYPSGLYGPICDIIPATEPEVVIPQVIITEPKITTGTTGTNGPDGGTEPPAVTKLIPKICRTVSVTSLYGGAFGPICDLPASGNDTNPLTICIVDPPVIEATYNPLPPLPPDFSLDVPNLNCKAKTIDLPTPDGTKTITYFYDCKPSIGDYTGPKPEDYGIPVTKKTIKYKYEHSLVCGGMDYYSSPGIYQQTIPKGVNLLTLAAIGAGGGSGGYDAMRNAGAGKGNCSGGSGSLINLSVNLDPTVTNTLEIVIGGGGAGGPSWHNSPVPTKGGFNRGGTGGHPAATPVSGSGGGGGGATDVFLNGRLILSAAGGGGGGGHGCLHFQMPTGYPFGNWNNYTYNTNNPTINSNALKVSRFSPISAATLHIPTIKHSLWSNWFKQYVVWFDSNQRTLPGQQLENRINLNFDTAGTYTFEFEGDNQLAIYIAPWYDPGDGSYVTDSLYNGSISVLRDLGRKNTTIPVDSSGTLQPPSTLAAEVTGASQWTFVGYTTDFTSETPTTATYTITTPGRYVIRTFLENAYGDPNKTDWLYNPGGMAIRILKPGGSVLWTTIDGFGKPGINRGGGDGPGSGGGGANEGVYGDVPGYGGGGCNLSDSTAQGGSAGWSYVIDHPAVTCNYFGQAPKGLVSGWATPTRSDASVRRGGGGFGAGRPYKFAIKYNGTSYNLYGSGCPAATPCFKSVTIPGMGTGVWQDHMSGRSFQYHYFWGRIASDSPSTTVPDLFDSGETFGWISLGVYEPAANCTASNRYQGLPGYDRWDIFHARSLQLAFQWTPIKTGANTWDTQIRIVGIPEWSLGTGFAIGDVLPGVFPPTRSNGTQPWWDILNQDLSTWHKLEFYDQTTKQTLPATIPGTSFNFEITVAAIDGIDVYNVNQGKPGFVKAQWYATNYENEYEGTEM